MNDGKAWYKSKGMWGGIGAILGGIGLLYESFEPGALIQSLAANLEAWYILATGVLATVGRAVANTKITK